MYVATYSFSHWILRVQLLGQAIVAQLDQVGFGEEDVQRFDVPSKQTHTTHSDCAALFIISWWESRVSTCAGRRLYVCERRQRRSDISTTRPPVNERAGFLQKLLNWIPFGSQGVKSEISLIKQYRYYLSILINKLIKQNRAAHAKHAMTGNLKGYYGKVIAFLIQTDFFMNIWLTWRMKAISYTWKIMSYITLIDNVWEYT